ncbi:MAG: toll/interleukin-1 receptor domain-containing protein [Rhizomicrobium sp.]
MAEQIYRYKAFISYRHVDRDRRWAKWLIDGLETFRTPRPLLAHGVPSHIGHLFRDDDEIPASSNLSGQIEEALKASQYLIVVCSPDTPQSLWVRHEIDFFRKLGKGGRILALLVEGEPTDSFPPELLHVPYEVAAPDGSRRIELRDEEPIAADIRPRSDESRRRTERRALLRIAATLLGCAFDDLAQRDHHRTVRRQRLIGGAIAAAVLIAVALGLWRWDYTRLKTAYFADIGTRWAEPFGIGALGDSDAAHRAVRYEIDSRRGHVIRVRRVNGSGGPKPLKGDEIDSDPWNKGVAEWRVRYEGDRVGTVELYGGTGLLLRTETYRFFPDGQTGLVAFTEATGTATALASNVSEFQTRVSASLTERHPEVTQHRLTFTPDGLLARRAFETVWGTPARDENGIAARVYTYTGRGQVAVLRNLSATGNVLVSKDGAAEERRAYTPAGDLALYDLRDAHGGRILAIAATYDAYGNPVEQLWTGPDGKPLLNAADGIARQVSEYDAHGNLIRATFFDETLQPAPGLAGYAQYTDEYDSLGRVVRTDYRDLQGRKVFGRNGVAGARLTFDAAGNVVELVALDLDGKPKMSTDGYARKTVRFNAAGRPVETHWFGADGKPIAKPDRIASLTDAYDSRGNLVDERYFGVTGRPVNAILDATAGADPRFAGYARVTRAYDDRGDATDEAYFGPDGRPAPNRLGIAHLKFFYTEEGYWSRLAFFGTDGLPGLNKDGAARYDFSYDTRGNVVEEIVFGVNGERVNSAAGYSRLAQGYDADDNMVAQHFFGPDDKPVLNAKGYAAAVSRYDAHGNDIQDLYLGIDGKPVLTRHGLARMDYVYDSRHKLIEQRFYDTDGRLTPGIFGFAILRMGYDRHGNQTDFATFGADGRPAVSSLGYARSHDTYDPRGNKVEAAYYGADGRPIAIAGGYAVMRETFDAVGNMTDFEFLGTDGRPVMAHGQAGTFARAHATYTPDGNLARIVFYDTAGKIVKR